MVLSGTFLLKAIDVMLKEELNECFDLLKGRSVCARYLEVIRKKQFAGSQVAQDEAEYLSVSVDKIMLLQTVQNNRFCAVEQATDSGGRKCKSMILQLQVFMQLLHYIKNDLAHIMLYF